MITLAGVDTTEHTCDCDRCKKMCEGNPCWPTPKEARMMINAGYGDRLMLDWWADGGYDSDDILLLCPASEGYEGKMAPLIDRLSYFQEKGPCVLHDSHGRCMLHSTGFKPLEGRIAIHQGDHDGLHEAMAESWNNEEAQELAQSWAEQHKAYV